VMHLLAHVLGKIVVVFDGLAQPAMAGVGLTPT